MSSAAADVFLLQTFLCQRKTGQAQTDETCIIRFLKDDDAYGFQTSVISVQFFPAPLIFFNTR
jgi:hypothetical protein